MFFDGLPKRPLNIAHRGARSLAPENTMCAARKGWQSKADAWELDVRMTADGEPVVIHDATLERTSDVKQVKAFRDRKPWWVHRFNLAELGLLSFGAWFKDADPFGQIKTGAVTKEDLERYAGEPAPTLREALSVTRDLDWRVNVELKDLSETFGGESIVATVVALVLELEMVDRVLISSFNHRYLKQVKAWAPRIATGALVEERMHEPERLLEEIGADAYHPRSGTTDRLQVRRLTEKGWRVMVWTVNDKADMSRNIMRGVTGIITDYPQNLARMLKD